MYFFRVNFVWVLSNKSCFQIPFSAKLSWSAFVVGFFFSFCGCECSTVNISVIVACQLAKQNLNFPA